MELRMFSLNPARVLCITGVLCSITMALLDPNPAPAASGPQRVFQTPMAVELATAIADNDAAAVRRLVQAGAKLSELGQQDVTLLQWAMLRNQPAMVNLLLSLGADPMQRGFDRQTALHVAAMVKGKAYLRMMLDHGADPNVRGGRTEAPVLSEALMSGNTSAVELLLAHHADPNATDRQGDTPLHVAAQINDYVNMLKLLEAGANPTIRNTSGQTFAAYYAIHPKESVMNGDALAARRAVAKWLDTHGVAASSK